MEGKRNLAGGGHVIAFDRPEGKWQVRAVRIHALRGSGAYDPATTFVTVTVADEKLAPLVVAKAAYERFPLKGPEWVDVPFEKPVEVPARFKISVTPDPAAPKGIYVGFSAVKESASGTLRPGATENPFTAGKDWMIRPVLAGEPPAAPSPREKELVELKHDSGTNDIMMMALGAAPSVEFEKPAGACSFRSARLFLIVIEPSALEYTVSAVTLDGKVLCLADASCKGVPTGDGTWVEVPFKTGVQCPDRFRIRVDFHWNLKRPEAEMVSLGTSSTTRTHSYMLTDHSPPQPLSGMEFMIRAILEK
jgi:hypothetical protein